jgi:uncharacterized protein YndB with AHSA1/START domain
VIEPYRLSFEVEAPREHAFDTYTRDIHRWWPESHTETGLSGVRVVMEGEVGGRIFERSLDGREWDWGRILVWEPPQRLVYSWHLRTEPEHATEVEIVFRAIDDDSTRVEIEHRGWEAWGDQAQDQRDQHGSGWGSLLPHYQQAVIATARKEDPV